MYYKRSPFDAMAGDSALSITIIQMVVQFTDPLNRGEKYFQRRL